MRRGESEPSPCLYLKALARRVIGGPTITPGLSSGIALSRDYPQNPEPPPIDGEIHSTLEHGIEVVIVAFMGRENWVCTTS